MVLLEPHFHGFTGVCTGPEVPINPVLKTRVWDTFWALWSVAGHASMTIPVLKTTVTLSIRLIGFSGAEIEI